MDEIQWILSYCWNKGLECKKSELYKEVNII